MLEKSSSVYPQKWRKRGTTGGEEIRGMTASRLAAWTNEQPHGLKTAQRRNSVKNNPMEWERDRDNHGQTADKCAAWCAAWCARSNTRREEICNQAIENRYFAIDQM